MEPLALPGISFRMLASADVDAALAVHEAAAGRLTNDMVRRESRDDLCQRINDGIVIGAVSADGTLVAYGALVVLSDSTAKLAALLELSDRERSRFCVLDGAAVLPEWQRRGMHKLLIRERLFYARDLVGVTVSPRNTRSLHNLLASNFRIARSVMLYGGFERLVLLRDMGIATRSVCRCADGHSRQFQAKP